MVTIKTAEEQKKMRIAGRLAADVLDMIGEHVVPGVTHGGLDRLCHDHIVKVQQAILPTSQLPRLPEDYLRLGQPRRLPRYPRR